MGAHQRKSIDHAAASPSLCLQNVHRSPRVKSARKERKGICRKTLKNTHAHSAPFSSSNPSTLGIRLNDSKPENTTFYRADRCGRSVVFFYAWSSSAAETGASTSKPWKLGRFGSLHQKAKPVLPGLGPRRSLGPCLPSFFGSHVSATRRL